MSVMVYMYPVNYDEIIDGLQYLAQLPRRWCLPIVLMPGGDWLARAAAALRCSSTSQLDVCLANAATQATTALPRLSLELRVSDAPAPSSDSLAVSHKPCVFPTILHHVDREHRRSDPTHCW